MFDDHAAGMRRSGAFSLRRSALLPMQCLESVAAQLSAAVFALIGGMLAARHDGPGYLRLLYNLNFARWGLEGGPLHHTIRLSLIQSTYLDFKTYALVQLPGTLFRTRRFLPLFSRYC
jgi:hypothetical protein